MNPKEMRKRIREFADRADDRMLRLMYALINEDETSIVAHTADGLPLTMAEYRAELMASEQEILRGDIISQEDIEKEAEQW